MDIHTAKVHPGSRHQLEENKMMHNMTDVSSVTRRPRVFTVVAYYDHGSYIYYGYVGPSITLLVTIVNILFIITLTKTRFRTSTHVILVAIAIVDILTGMIPLPFNIYMFSYRRINYKDPIKLGWCWVFHIVQVMSPVFFHLISLGLTVVLSVERYLLVAYPIVSKTILTVRNGCIVCVAVFLLCIAVQADSFLDTSFEPIEIFSKDRTYKFKACTKQMKDVNQIDLIVRLAVVRLVPCLLLVIFTILILRKSSEVKTFRKQHSSNSESVASLRRMDIAVSLIAGIVCVTELVVSSVLLAEYIIVDDVRALDESRLMGIMYVVYVTVGPINFIIVCLLSRDFRNTLKGILLTCFCCCSRRKYLPRKTTSQTVVTQQTY